MEAMEVAFSGTHFHGSEMLRDTMLLSSTTDTTASGTSRTLTLSEMALLSARGLRHSADGPESALGTIQRILNDLVDQCFSKWARVAISKPLKECVAGTRKLIDTASTVNHEEWKRLYIYNSVLDRQEESMEEQSAIDSPDIGSVSSFVVSFFISIASILNQSVSPSDSIQPFSSQLYAREMGIESNQNSNMTVLLRSCIQRESLLSLSKSLHALIISDGSESGQLTIAKCCSSSLLQILHDLSFISQCYFKNNIVDFALGKPVHIGLSEDMTMKNTAEYSKHILEEMISRIKIFLHKEKGINDDEYLNIIERRQQEVFEACNLFFTALFGERKIDVQGANANSLPGGITDFRPIPLLVNPLPSSRRFLLLPIQAEQSMKELELIQNLEKERTDKVETEKKGVGSTAASAVTSGFGFFSSMLNKKK
jgi:hypothetical protein